jgi:hypothetical protein
VMNSFSDQKENVEMLKNSRFVFFVEKNKTDRYEFCFLPYALKEQNNRSIHKIYCPFRANTFLTSNKNSTDRLQNFVIYQRNDYKDFDFIFTNLIYA